MAKTEIIAELSGAGKAYGKSVVVKSIDLVVRSGELLALLGPNGAGKSTTIGLLLGVVAPTSGSARLFGSDRPGLRERRRLGVMAQSAALPPTLKVRELVELFSSYYPHPFSLAEVAEKAHIGPILNRPYGQLSGGQMRTVQFAVAICGRPDLLFLDEPTTGLDIEARRKLWDTVEDLVRKGCGVVLTTHHLEEAEALADRVVVLKSGEVLTTGTVDEIRRDAARTYVSCTSSLTPERINGWPGVKSVRKQGDMIEIVTARGDSAVTALVAEDPDFSSLQVRSVSLEEAFGELIKEPA